MTCIPISWGRCLKRKLNLDSTDGYWNPSVLQTTSVIDGSQLSQHTLPQTPLDLISSLPSQGPDPSTSLTVDTSVEYMHSLMRYGQFSATIYAILIQYHIHRKLQI